MDKTLKELNLEKSTIQILNENNIFNIKELWCQNKTGLKQIGCTPNQIKEIIISLQLNGLDLNKKKY